MCSVVVVALCAVVRTTVRLWVRGQGIRVLRNSIIPAHPFTNAMASLLAHGHPLSLLIVFFKKKKSQRIRRYGKGRLRIAVSWHHTSVVSPPAFYVAPFQTGITRCPVCLVTPFVPATSICTASRIRICAVGLLACALCAVARASDGPYLLGGVGGRGAG